MLFPTVVMPMVFTTPSWLTRLSGVAVHIIAPGDPGIRYHGDIGASGLASTLGGERAGAGRQDHPRCGWDVTADSTNLAEVAVAVRWLWARSHPLPAGPPVPSGSLLTGSLLTYRSRLASPAANPNGS